MTYDEPDTSGNTIAPYYIGDLPKTYGRKRIISVRQWYEQEEKE